MTLTTTKLAPLSTRNVSATRAARAVLNATFRSLRRSSAVLVALEAVMWTTNVIRVLLRVGILMALKCEAMTRTEPANDEIPIAIGQGRSPSTAMGTRVALSIMPMPLAGATVMLPTSRDVSRLVFLITASLVGPLLFSVRRVTTLRVPMSRSCYVPRFVGVRPVLLVMLARTDVPNCPTLPAEVVSAPSARSRPVRAVLPTLLDRGMTVVVLLLSKVGLVPPSAPRLATPSYGDRLMLATSVLMMVGLEPLPR